MGDYNFGALPPLPDGYRVDWVKEVEHYMAFGPDEWESVITCDPYQARRWCFYHAESKSGDDEMDFLEAPALRAVEETA